MRVKYGLMALLLVAVVAARASEKEAPLGEKTRTFQFTYTATVKEIPQGAQYIDLWIPVPQDTKHQKIKDLDFAVSRPIILKMEGEEVAATAHLKKKPEIKTEKTLDNKMAHWRVPAKEADGLTVKMTFVCERTEAAVTDFSKVRELSKGELEDLGLWLAPNKLVTVGGDFVAYADTATKGAKTPAEIAKAAYDYTVSTMKYDKPKEKPGWGKGSTQWACDAKLGNCTDFHAMIMSIGRTKGVPVKFEMGFPLPERKADKPETSGGTIGGYHCWAKMYLGNIGWVPVDASEANKFADKRDYFYGHICENRVQFTNGRDVNLEPRQQGEPLNYFIYPYAEADGKSITVEKAFEFKDIPAK